MAKFEKVSRFENEDLHMPERATAHAAGYDLYAAEDIKLQPYTNSMKHIINIIDDNTMPPLYYSLSQMAAITKQNSNARPYLISTGMKVKLADDEYLELLPRSSTPLKYWLVLANSAGIIDADYYNNPDNEGEIFLQFINFSPVPIFIQKGDCIGQGIIHKFEITEDDSANGERLGGFGSTH